MTYHQEVTIYVQSLKNLYYPIIKITIAKTTNFFLKKA